MSSLFNKLTTKQLLVIIIILLVVLASPVIINTFNYLSRNVSNFIVFNKEKYCAREYPAHTVKALTPNEFDSFVAKEVESIVRVKSYSPQELDNLTDSELTALSERMEASTKYNFLKVGKYKNLSYIEAMKLFYNWRLTDTYYSQGVYRGGNSCEGSSGLRLSIGEIPWYYF